MFIYRLALLFAAGSLIGNEPALAQAPFPLPTDTNLAAYISVSGNFRNLSGQQRQLTMSCWVAAYTPGEQIDFSSITDKAFLTLGLPDEGGWGYFNSIDATLTTTVHITDAKNRLGHIVVKENDTGKLVADLQANAAHSEIQGSFQNDSSVRDYVATVFSTSGTTLSTLAVDLGKWDTIAWYSQGGGFEPFCPAPIACSQYTPAGPPNGSDYFGVIGDPTKAPGVLTGISYMGRSRGCATQDVTNDQGNTISIGPPSAYSFVKKGLDCDTVSLAGIKIKDPASYTQLQNLIASLTQTDPTPALSGVTFPPYSKGYAYWRIDFQGQATAILAIPFERERKGGNWSIVLNAIVPILQPKADFLSHLVIAAATDWLANQANQQASGLRPGDVFSLGDIYVLTASQGAAEPRNLMPILQNVTFQLKPDIPPPSSMGGMGMGQLDLEGASTTPSPPPYPTGGTTLSFNPPNWSTNLTIAKGWKWKASGNITAPMGYQGGFKEFTSPSSGTVTIPVKLTVLLQLQVYTSDPSEPVSAQVQLINSSGQVFGQATSASDGKGNDVATFITVPPGTYTVKATAPYRSPGEASVNVQVGISQTTTVTLGAFQPPPPPGQ